ncbi:MAG: NTP transferase domain-containing protein [Synergistaceae bacterium]|jgi:CTP:molybdopterin cytidylyltransferase MocA|nr:NTP transferase domain-containing protein [Synergistaceae bacterium]
MKKNGECRITGLILAGGISARMGECKALLPLPRKSALEAIVSRMRSSGVGTIIVVTGCHEETVRREALRLDCVTVHNPAFKSGMFSSVLAGVRALRHRSEAFFLLPVDIPLVKRSTYRSLIDAFNEGYGAPDVVYPTFMGERGHPPLIGRELIKGILKWKGESGLKGFLDECAGSLDIPTGDRGTQLDMDTPEDYRKLMKYVKGEKYPDDDECAELLSIAGTPPRIVRHMKVVAMCADRIAGALDETGISINRRLLRSACLLHDISKGEKDHEAQGARWLRGRGYTGAAKLVACHKDLPERRKSLGEAEILYLADKITDGEMVSTLKHRLLRMQARFAPENDAISSAKRRIKLASDIQKKVEKSAGRSLEEILTEAPEAIEWSLRRNGMTEIF